uniref:RING finger protein nhl-1 n=1 Tax=Cacopsylla melanoneura TaxID=428564 RepID=A0A8D8UJI0_9HEMI
MEQFEQLLTCAICLDRYRNPKLLPCQHSFCMEPCMDGLVDYVRRQVKCPECRAEHRIPYQGVQGFPTNVTLQRFLELHIEITGELPDPTSGQTMKRCSVCSEKSYVTMCGHCDKEVCADCKGAHMDILRREIARINSQVRRALHRLQDMLALVERNMLALQTNCNSVSEEVEEIHSRLTKALKDRTEFLQGELDRYLTTEVKNLSQLKENLELEIANISSNCDLADEHMQNENVEWDDLELMDAKEIFLRTVEFIRNFETETTDYTRRVRFVMTHDPNTLVLNVAGYGELSINMPHPVIQSLQPPGPGLMRSKSDHRLASQYRGEDRTYDRSPYDASDPMQGRVSPLGGRKFGERPRERTDVNSSSRYGGRNEREYGEEYDPDNRQSARSRIRARFRHGAGEADSDSETHGGRSVRFNETHAPPAKEREKVLDTEDVAKGPLSGITRLLDSPRVMKKLLDSSIKKTKKENEPAPPLPTQNQKNPIVRKMSSTPATPPVTQRQVSEDDEIARIKKQNKTAGSSSETVTREPVRPSSERVAALKQQSSSDQRTPERSPSRRPSTQEVTSSEADSDEEVAAIGSLRKTSTTASPPNTKPAPPRRVGAEVVGNRPSTTSTTATPTKPTPPATKEEEEEDDDDEEETEEETETSSESEETESEEEAVAKKPAAAMEKTDIGPLLARAANARDTTTPSSSTSNARDAFISSRYNNSSDSKDSTSYKPYGSKDETSTTGSIGQVGTTPRSQYLQKRRLQFKIGSRGSEPGCFTWPRGIAVGPDNSIVVADSSNHRVQVFDSDGIFTKEFGSYGNAEGEFDCLAGVAVNRIGQFIIADRYNHRIQVMDPSGRFLRAFGSQGTADGKFNYPWGITTDALGFIYVCDKENHRVQVFQSDGTFVGKFGSMGNKAGQLEHPHYIAVSNTNRVIVSDSNNHRVQIFDVNGRVITSFGSEGSEEGQFKFPRGVAVDDQGFISVGDSGNNRIQIFTPDGQFLRAFGCWGSGDAEFKGLEGVAVMSNGNILVCDRENHRIQVF